MKYTLLSSILCLVVTYSTAQTNCGISNLKVDDTGFVSWYGQQDPKGLVYQLEQYRWHKWIKVAEVDGRPGNGSSSYGLKIIGYHGMNTVRIRLSDPDCISDSITADLHIPEVKYTIRKKNKEILFSSETLFEILDLKGTIVKRGYGMNASYKDLPKGMYTLNYDNASAGFKN